MLGQRLQSNYPRIPPMQQQQMRPYATAPFGRVMILTVILINYVLGPQPSAGAPPFNVVGTPAVSGSGSVIMVYGLMSARINCDHIFNLLCSYGNVLKVRKE